jgi:threonylcarbamoyladenosine tRNA methylthiotransferase MtaB
MATQRSVAFQTLGCKLNFSETSSIKRQFEGHGYIAVPYSDPADIYVLNTCSVTDFADRKCRKAVRSALKVNPDARVVVIGCYAQLKPKEISEIEGVDLVLGATEKFNILNYIDDLSATAQSGMIKAGDLQELKTFENAYSIGDRTRSFLKVQDGCDYKCTFCTIPQARGKSRSDTIENVVKSAKAIAQAGVKEVVLTGVNIGDFGLTEVAGSRDRANGTFLDLITALDKVDGISRFRISSIEPNLCDDAIIEFVAQSERFVPHFHMPLQSGSDKILKDMRRRYKSSLYVDRVAKIKSLMPHCCIGVDVIVGFPGETEEDFMVTYNFLKDLDISYLHVFTYSERNNTLAAVAEGAVPMEERRRRNQMLTILSQKKKRQFYEQHLGTSRTVLFEKSKRPGMMTGFTDNYVKVETALREEMINFEESFALAAINEKGLVTA